MRFPFVPWWRLRALPGLAWRAFREDPVFRIATLGASAALFLLLMRLFEAPSTAGRLPTAGEAQDGLPTLSPLLLPERPPVPPPGSLSGGVPAPAGAVHRIDPGQPLDAASQPAQGDRFGTVAPQPTPSGPRP